LRIEERKEQGTRLVEWYLRFAMDSGATSWSMEQVPTPVVQEVLKKLRARKSPYRNRLAWTLVNFRDYGVPQYRKRIIAGSPDVIARLKRLPLKRRGVREVVPVCRGTHVRNEVKWSDPRPAPEGHDHRYVYKLYGDDDCCIPVEKPGYCITARHTLRWATPGTGSKLLRMTPRETALMQTFPGDYQLDENKQRAIRGIGNAIPPLIMKQILPPPPPPLLVAELVVRQEPVPGGGTPRAAGGVLDLAEGLRCGSPSLR